MDAKNIADRYVSRGGVPHGKPYDSAGDLLVVGSFLAWREPNEMSGGYRADDAWAALCRLLDVNPVELRNAIRGSE